MPILGRRPLNTLRRSDIIAFIAALTDKGLAPSTVRMIYNLPAMILRSAVYDRLLPASPCYRIKLPPIPPRRLAVFTPVEEQCLTPQRGQPYLTTRLKTPASRRVVPLPQFVVDAPAHHPSAYDVREDGVIFRNPRGGRKAAEPRTWSG